MSDLHQPSPASRKKGVLKCTITDFSLPSCKLWPLWSHTGQTILHWQQWYLANDQTRGKKVEHPLITSLQLCAHLARNIRYLRSSAGWHTLPQHKSVEPSTLYSHSLQRISASKLPPQLPQKHHQTNGTASRYSQVVTATLDRPQPKSTLEADTNDLHECHQNKNHLWVGSSGGSHRMSEAEGTRCCQWP